MFFLVFYVNCSLYIDREFNIFIENLKNWNKKKIHIYPEISGSLFYPKPLDNMGYI